MSESTPNPEEASEAAPSGEVRPPEEAASSGTSGEEPPQDGDASASATEVPTDGSAPPKRKRKRRKRKKKKAEGDANEAQGEASPTSDDARPASPPEAEGQHEAPRGDPPPFQHLFVIPKESSEHKAPGFKVGSLVAGHVVFVGDGAAVINLYGKGTAFVLENEPREIPTLVLHEPEPAETDDAPAEEESADASEASETSDENSEPDEPKEATPATQYVTRAGARLFDPVPEDGESTPTRDAPSDPPSELPGGEESLVETNTAETDVSDPAEPVLSDATEPADDTAVADPGAEPPLPPLELGQLFRGRVGAVAESGHVALVNRNIDRAAARTRLKEAKNARQRVCGLVFGYNRGGFDVLVEGMRAYCPVRGLSITPIDDPIPFLGRVLEFQVQSAKSGKQGIVVSRRTLLEREAKKAARHRLKLLAVGEILEGTVERVFEFGLIVDLGGGLEGMVHRSELSWDHAVRPSDVAKLGDTVRVKVLDIDIPSKSKPPTSENESGKPERAEKNEKNEKNEKKRKRRSSIALSIRALEEDPWTRQVAELRPGKAVRGQVASTTEFGAFVELGPNVQGLLHVSELRRSDGREEPIAHANEVLSVGDAIVVVVERIERDRRRVGLSMLEPADLPAFEAGTLDDTGDPDRVRPGGHLPVLVVSADRNGVRVRIAGVLGRRGRGFIRPGDTGTQRGTDLRKKFKTGTPLEVKIVGTDRDGSLRCSIKALAVDEERQAIKAYKQKSQKEGFGTLGDLLRNKLSER